VLGGHLDWGATVVLVAVGVLATALAAVLFRSRDVGGAWLRGRTNHREARLTASANPIIRVPVLRGLWEQRVGLAVWAIGLAVLAGFLTSLVNTTVGVMMSNPLFRRYLQGTADPHVAFLGLYWFSFAALLVAVFTVVQVARWAGDDLQGRLELVLARPVARWQVILERALTLAAEVVLIAAAGSLAVAAVAAADGIHADPGRLVGATALLLPVALTFGAAGAAVAAWLPRTATTVLTGVAVLSYFLQELGPLFKWPDWVQNLSLFKLYGTPLSAPVFWNGVYAMIAVTVVGFGVAMLAMQRREVGR